MPGGPKAKKAKRNRNISGLKNQSRNSPLQSDSTPHPTPPRSQAPSPEPCSEVLVDDDLEGEDDFENMNYFDSLKADYQREDAEDGSDEEDSGDELMELRREDLTEIMVNMMLEDDPNDLDWIPEKFKAKRKEKAKGERPKQYAKGPDVMSKSKRTQERYRKQNKDQTSLTRFGFSIKSAVNTISHPIVTNNNAARSPQIMTTTAQPRPSETDVLPPSGSRTRSASVLSDPSTDAGDRTDQDDPSSLADVQEVDEDIGGEIQAEGLDEQEIYESDLEEAFQGPKCAMKDWSELRKQIKTHLRKHSKSLPLSKINQYLIISNFATLRLKGLSRTQASIEIANQWHEGPGNWFARRVRALAWHYQEFEELPVERRGGENNARSWLHDEAVQSRTRDWLTSQKTGKVTPRCLQHALNEVIFPDLNIILKSPLCERTARRWLIKLGWRQTVV
ncbi:hypothetical protein JOM56_011577 [Amanita muscaria]